MGLKLVRNADDVERLTSPYLQPHDCHAALIHLAEKGGEYGFMLLYIYASVQPVRSLAGTPMLPGY